MMGNNTKTNLDTNSPSTDQTEHYIQTVNDAVKMRLVRGDRPEDAMMLANNMLEAWVAVWVDNGYPAPQITTVILNQEGQQIPVVVNPDETEDDTPEE